MNRYVGIDPGSKGAIAVIDDNDIVVALEDLSKEFSSYWYPATYLKDDFNYYSAVEDVCGRPGQSCKANTTFMKLAGMAEYLGWYLADCDDQFTLVKPQVWKKHFGLIFPKTMTKTEKKHHSVALARELFPSEEEKLLIGKDGRAEALLIARYCKDVLYKP